MHPFLGRLIVNFVLCLICFIAYSSQIFIIWPWYGSVLSVELITLLLPFNILVGLLLWNYFLCVFTDPGRVPDSWRPDTHSDGYEVKKLTGTPRYCRICQNYKPPRSHHCRQCNRCVLRMDHHCPWINNCVGHFNHGHFLRFLFFVDVACAYHFMMVTKRVLLSMEGHYADQPSTLELIMIILNYVTCIPVLLAVGGFSLFHFWYLFGNTTTIEGWEKDKVALLVKKGRAREVKYPYDLGLRRNIESILGPNPLLWCWPTRTPGSGLKYELSNKDVDHEVWPPKDYSNELDKTSVTLPDSPWTYENGSFNPNLKPTNSRLSNRRPKRNMMEEIPGSSSVPPYHPDYGREVYKSQYSSSEDEDPEEGEVEGDEYGYEVPPPLQGSTTSRRVHVRRGSEGYEVRPQGREEMLRRYLEELGEVEAARYVRYIPEVGSESDEDEDEDDDVPLGRRGEVVG